jgi:hypothetical protein
MGPKLYSEKWEISLSRSLYHRRELHTRQVFYLNQKSGHWRPWVKKLGEEKQVSLFHTIFSTHSKCSPLKFNI